jgi:hypothetical protein
MSACYLIFSETVSFSSFLTSLRILTDALVNLVSTGAACLTKLLELQDTARVELKPVLILLDVPLEETLVNSPSSPQSPYRLSALDLDGSAPGDEEAQNGENELYGLALVQRIVSESYMRNLSKLVLAVPLIIIPPELSTDDNDTAAEADCEDYNGVLLSCNSETRRARNRRLLRRCLDLGATDVMSSPMNAKCITNLEVHAYRAYRDAAREQKSMLEVRKGRKRSWVGIHEEKPFSYLREAMVAGLMNGICRIGDGLDDRLSNARVYVSPERQAEVAAAVGQWHFCAHDFSEDELIVAAAVMFRHALAMPELEQWRIPPGRFFILFAWLRCTETLLTASSRSAQYIPSFLPGCLQRLRSISQLPARRGRSASDLPLSGSNWRSASVSCSQRTEYRLITANATIMA